MFCSKCGNELENDALFCEVCGNKVVKKDAPVDATGAQPVVNTVGEGMNIPVENAPKKGKGKLIAIIAAIAVAVIGLLVGMIFLLLSLFPKETIEDRATAAFIGEWEVSVVTDDDTVLTREDFALIGVDPGSGTIEEDSFSFDMLGTEVEGTWENYKQETDGDVEEYTYKLTTDDDVLMSAIASTETPDTISLGIGSGNDMIMVILTRVE